MFFKDSKMKNLLIVGAGGFGREVYNLAIHCKEHGSNFNIKGFLDDNDKALDGFKGYPKILSNLKDYLIEKDDVFVCAIGTIDIKKSACNLILNKGGEFINLIHPTSFINQNVKIGIGVIVFMNSNISNDCIIQDFVTIQGFVGLGHDTQIGKWCHINTYSFTGGGVNIGDEVLVNTRSTILPKVKVFSGATIGACSLVIRNVKENTTVFGVPATRLIS
jgi:sugar O-acyltransferase (sialic acid O-acetyltransferase NeuD family)